MRRLLRIRRRVTAETAGIFVAIIGASVALAAACLPSLDANAPTPPPPVKGPFCGDGLIQVVASDAGADAEGGVAREDCDPSDGGILGCTRACTIACESGYLDPDTNHCYQAGAKAASYRDAIEECTKLGAHVVTFASDEERNRVLDAGIDGVSLFWVGLAQDPAALAYTAAAAGEPGWAQGTPPPCTGCFAKPGPQGNQIPKKPDAATGTLPCVGDGKGQVNWFQMPASLPNPATGAIGVICEREPAGLSHEPCDGGTCIAIKHTAGRKRYLAPARDGTAAEADTYCRGLGPLSRLVVLETREEREGLMKEVSRIFADKPAEGALWIGLARSTTGDGGTTWSWDNGSPESAYPSVWGDKEPKPTATPTARAFIGLDPIDYDIQLAHAGAGDARHRFVCEY